MLEDFIKTIILSLIQGFTEWLPVSSTAHLKIAERLLGLATTPLFNVTLHVGTLFVVIFYFRKQVKGILSALVHLDFTSEHGQLIVPIIIATIPTAVIGLLYVELLENSLQTFLAIGITFLIGGAIVYASRIGKEHIYRITYLMAFSLGAAQGLAVFPGLSRSGVTISSALLLGLKREKAFDFSFLLSIPAIAGDLIVEAYKQRGNLGIQGVTPMELAVGIAITIISGYVAIKLVSKSVRSRKFHYFAFYTLSLGTALIILALTGL